MPRLRSHVASLQEVETGAAIFGALERRGLTDVVRLNSNEGPRAPFPEALEALDAAARGANRYPEPTAALLGADLARHFGVTPDHVHVGSGSTSLIFLLAAALLEPDDELSYPWPSFPQYKAAAIHQRARPAPVPLRDFSVDLDATLAAITPRTRMVIVANPNNPTGTETSRAALDRFVAALPHEVLLVLDEAYAEYSEDLADGSRYVREGREVVVLRTFSKIYGLAAARVGYAVGQPELISALRRLQVPFAVSQLGLAGARASLAQPGHLAQRAQENARGRQQLYDGFRALGLAFVPSSANFVLVDVGRDSFAVYEDLIVHGVLVRPGRGYTYYNHLRVTVGLESENSRFLDALKAVLEREGPR